MLRKQVWTLATLCVQVQTLEQAGYPKKSSGFHSHATPLHQAVASGSLECIKLLAGAGAVTDAQDTVYSGSPPGWAKYMQQETDDEKMKEKYKAIAGYLKGLS